MSEIQELFEWLLENAGRLPTTVVLDKRPNGILDIRFYDVASGYVTISRKQCEGQMIYGINAERKAGDIFSFLQECAQQYTVGKISNPAQFSKLTVDLCRSYPVYLDQLLARLDSVNELCRNTQDTSLHAHFSDLRSLIQLTIDNALGEDRFHKAAA